jgi:hypothetical protein
MVLPGLFYVTRFRINIRCKWHNSTVEYRFLSQYSMERSISLTNEEATVMRAVTIFTGIFMLGLMLNPAIGEDWVYKWVDADGVTHYGARPPAWANPQPTSVLVQRTDPQAVQTLLDREGEMRAAVSTRKQQEAESAAEDKQWEEDAAKQRAENCKTAQDRVNAYDTAQRLYREQEDGERAYLDDDEIDAARADAHKLVSEWCDN